MSAALVRIAGTGRFLAFTSARMAEEAKWKALSVSTDFDGLVDVAKTAIDKRLVAKRS